MGIKKESPHKLIKLENPELLVLRARRAYLRQGKSRRWIDQRLGGMGVRQDLVGEWNRRGVAGTEQFRDLTNSLMQESFGVEVEAFRHNKRLTGTKESLRDHMSDLELVLTTLGEATAAELHRAHDSRSFDALLADAREAGRIVARTRAEIESRLGHTIVLPDVAAT